MTASPQHPLVLLDLDGTLMDSAPGILASVTHAYRTLGLPVPDAATLRSFVGPPITESFPSHGVPSEQVEEAIKLYRADFAETGMWDNSVFDGVPAQLERLRDAGCTLAVATSKPEVFARPITERFGLAPLVDAVFGAPLDEQGTKADVIAKALATLGRTPADGPALMVGDREHDVVGAREHGIDCLGVTWGYAAPGELEEAGAVAVLDDVDQLAEQVLRLLG
ncbi:haloacid dehalogenase [Xylanimonas oleitrophica]|uniref:Haloacid dehalogenase n=1 Tax=Xylanimonas oleitrophica TaxID=2607479 RepID=A0A2W5WWE4_9MICO|nr:HAD hydrolase-like protein [Xylanimonas oleitrophica]PZR52616.1 haloacid dehalogenase [Xylanimonas oleitrophica]